MTTDQAAEIIKTLHIIQYCAVLTAAIIEMVFVWKLCELFSPRKDA